MPPSSSRPSRREIAAAATRTEILGAARRLFMQKGYAQTSIADVATEAGVAVQTIYSSVGPKAALVLALNDRIDEEAEVGPLFADLLAADDPYQIIHLAVRISRQLNERCGDLVTVLVMAAQSDADLLPLVAKDRRRQAKSGTAIAGRLDALGALKPGLSIADAALMLSMLTALWVWADLMEHGGWDADRAEAWIEETLSRSVLADTAGAHA